MNVRQYNASTNLSSIYDRPLTSLGYKESMFSALSSSSSSLKRYTSPSRRPQTTASNIPSYMSKAPPRAYYATPTRDYRDRMELSRSTSLNSSMSQPRDYSSSQLNQRYINDDYNDFGSGFNYGSNSTWQELKDQILSPGDEESTSDLLYARNYERMYGYGSSYRPMTANVTSSPSYGGRHFNITQTNIRDFRMRGRDKEDEFERENREWIRERSRSEERDFRNYNHYNSNNNSLFNNLSSSFSAHSNSSSNNNYRNLPKYTPSYARPQTAFIPQHYNTFNQNHSQLNTSSPFISPSIQGNLLPPCDNNNKHRKTLILDLDETLVHSDFRPFYFKPDITLNVRVNHLIEPVYVLKRPYVDEFLRKMATMYEIVIFTASIPQYANPLLDILDTNRIISYRLFREHCVYNKGLFIKDLNKLGRNLKDVLIVDNNPISYASNKENGIPIPTWHYDKTDTELLKLIPVLEFLANVDDVRDYIKRIVSADQINFYDVKNIINNVNHNNDNSSNNNNTSSSYINNYRSYKNNNNIINNTSNKVISNYNDSFNRNDSGNNFSNSYRSNFDHNITNNNNNNSNSIRNNFNKNLYNNFSNINLNNNYTRTNIDNTNNNNNTINNNNNIQHINPLIHTHTYPSYIHSDYTQNLRRDIFEKEKEREIQREREMEKERQRELEKEQELEIERERMFSNTSTSSFYRPPPSYFSNNYHNISTNNNLNNTSVLFNDNYRNRMMNISSSSSPSRIQIQNTNISTINNLRPYYYG